MSERPTNTSVKQYRPANAPNLTAWLSDLVYTGGAFRPDLAIICDRDGRIVEISENIEGITNVVRLKNQAALPGMTNAHSHAFQRVIRGRTEARTDAVTGDNFWTWRNAMYAAANRLSPEDLYDASRMAFLEMALGGITAVGEFHYLHRTSEGTPYDDPNLLSKQVVRAARDTGLRIALLRTAYARSGFQKQADERQRRFIEANSETFIGNTEALRRYLAREHAPDEAWAGVAPHSVRAVPLPYLHEVCSYAAEHNLPVHIHVAEQPAEVDACIAEHGRAPVALLNFEELLNEHFTAVHAIHISDAEVNALTNARAFVCACPTTERNLGDGIVQADLLVRMGFAAEVFNPHIALGTDSHAQIDLLEDARCLEYHLRLQRLERAVLPAYREEASGRRWHIEQGGGNGLSGLAATLLACATIGGAKSIGAASNGRLEAGQPADFFTVALDDPSIAGAGAEDLLPAIVFSLVRTAVRTVVVGGRTVVADGCHAQQSEIVERFTALQRKLWR